jgi:cyclic pyranopterin phosphate synthase
MIHFSEQNAVREAEAELSRREPGTAETLRADGSEPVRDVFGRPLRSLRISVTDKCNLRCRYCMPEEEYVWLGKEEILSFEEIAELTGIFTGLGVDRIRLTGGEPLLRRELDVLVRLLCENSRIHDLAMTTNGVLLDRFARSLREAGLQRVTVSLDTLRPERFRALTRRDEHDRVLAGIAAAREAGFGRLKLNTVVMRGFNDDELGDLVRFGAGVGAEVRFIEYMDVGGATRWTSGDVVSRREILELLGQELGPPKPLEENGSAPADRFILPDGTTFGVISSTTEPFCRDCDRARLTTDGMWLLCLYARDGVDLKRLLRGGAPREEIAATISSTWRGRTDRGAEERLAQPERGVLFQIEDLRRDPHREMHTRGG